MKRRFEDEDISNKRRKLNSDILTTILGENPITKIFDSIVGKDKVTQDSNHIYFTDDVTIDSVKTLIDTINEINREVERSMAENTNVYTFSKPIYLHITSNGGSVYAGFLAYDHIKNSKVPIYTVVDGYAISAASMMFMAGKKRFMNPSSYVLIHQMRSYIENSMSTYENIKDEFETYVEHMSRIYRIYINESRHSYSPVPLENVLTQNIIEEMLKHDIMWNFETCHKYGLVDDIYINYQDREEQDRKDFYLYLVKSDVVIPTYAESISRFDFTKYKPSQDVEDTLLEALELEASKRKLDNLKKLASMGFSHLKDESLEEEVE